MAAEYYVEAQSHAPSDQVGGCVMVTRLYVPTLFLQISKTVHVHVHIHPYRYIFDRYSIGAADKSKTRDWGINSDPGSRCTRLSASSSLPGRKQQRTLRSQGLRDLGSYGCGVGVLGVGRFSRRLEQPASLQHGQIAHVILSHFPSSGRSEETKQDGNAG